MAQDDEQLAQQRGLTLEASRRVDAILHEMTVLNAELISIVKPTDDEVHRLVDQYSNYGNNELVEAIIGAYGWPEDVLADRVFTAEAEEL